MYAESNCAITTGITKYGSVYGNSTLMQKANGNNNASSSLNGIQIRMIHQPQTSHQRLRLPPYLPSIRDLLDQVSRRHNQHQTQPWINSNTLLVKSATSTPHIPFGTSDLIGSFNNDTNRITNNGEDNKTTGKADDDSKVNGTSLAKIQNKNTFISTRERATFADLRGGDLDDSFQPTNRSSHFKPMGIRNTFLTTKGIAATSQNQAPILTIQNNITSNTNICANTSQASNTNSSEPNTPPGKESDDLVAMGTNWAPPPSHLCTVKNSGRSNSLSNSSAVHITQNGHGVNSNTSPIYGMKRINKVATMPHLSSISRHNLKDKVEPKYTDPLAGAPNSFHQRISELSNLESETIRWERAKKFKRKSKDS